MERLIMLVKIESERYHMSNGQTDKKTRYFISGFLAVNAVKINAAALGNIGQ